MRSDRSDGPVNEWLDIETLKILSRHASGVIGAIVLFRAIRLVAEWGLHDGRLRDILEAVDSFVLVGLLIWLAIQMGILLWRRRDH